MHEWAAGKAISPQNLDALERFYRYMPPHLKAIYPMLLNDMEVSAVRQMLRDTRPGTAMNQLAAGVLGITDAIHRDSLYRGSALIGWEQVRALAPEDSVEYQVAKNQLVQLVLPAPDVPDFVFSCCLCRRVQGYAAPDLAGGITTGEAMDMGWMPVSPSDWVCPVCQTPEIEGINAG